MTRGSATPDDVEFEFRKHYLTTGNASASAKAVGIPISTGTELAKRAVADPEFVKARDEIRARILPDAERMLMSGLELALERMNEPPPTPQELAHLASSFELKSIGYQDPRPNYFRGMSAAVSALAQVKKNEQPSGSDQPVEVHVHLKPPKQDPEPAESGDDGGKTTTD